MPLSGLALLPWGFGCSFELWGLLRHSCLSWGLAKKEGSVCPLECGRVSVLPGAPSSAQPGSSSGVDESRDRWREQRRAQLGPESMEMAENGLRLLLQRETERAKGWVRKRGRGWE